MNDHFQGNIYKCFAVRACGSDCVSACSWREVDCILFGMFNVEKKQQRPKSPLLPPGFHKLSNTVWLPPCSWAPSVFHHRPTKSESVIYWTQAHFFVCFLAILKEEIQSCDRLRNTLFRTRGQRWQWQPALVHSFSFQLKLPGPIF